jgi:hypothetical protein
VNERRRVWFEMTRKKAGRKRKERHGKLKTHFYTK